MHDVTDATLVKQAINGDKRAFGLLIQRYYALVERLASQRVPPDVVADIAQETCLQAFLSLDRLRDPSRFRGWLCGIALNLCRLHLRRLKHAPLAFDPNGQTAMVVVDKQPTPDEWAEKIDLYRTLQAAIDNLSHANRKAVILYYYEGFSLREISDVLEISVNAVKGRLHKARQQLRASLWHLHLSHSTRDTIGADTMIPVEIIDIPQQVKTNRLGQYYTLQQLLLFNVESRRTLVIWIGEEQAITIAQALAGRRSERPGTHQFALNLLQATGATIERVVLEKLEGHIYFARVEVKQNNQVHQVDARPSDGIALAVQVNAPLFASPELWEKASPPIPEGKTPNRSGINQILGRLDEIYEENQRWIKQKQLEWADKGVNPDDRTREQAREIIDAAFE